MDCSFQGSLIPLTFCSQGAELNSKLCNTACSLCELKQSMINLCSTNMVVEDHLCYEEVTAGRERRLLLPESCPSPALFLQEGMSYATLLLSVGKLLGCNWKARVHCVINPRHLSGFPSYLSGAGSLGSSRRPAGYLETVLVGLEQLEIWTGLVGLERLEIWTDVLNAGESQLESVHACEWPQLG